MFVPTHLYDNHTPMTIIKGGYYYDHHKKYVYNIIFTDSLTPITLACPYCDNHIHQQERVKCDCGWTADAISEDLFIALGDGVNSLGWLTANRTPFVKHHHINGIHWLEIQPGKEAE